MVLIGVKTEKSGIVDTFFCDVQERLTNKAKTPFFVGHVFDRDDVHLIYIKILYPPYFLFGLLFWIIGFIVTRGFSLYWFIPGLIILLPIIFYTRIIYYIVLYIALRKKGYRGKIHIE